MILLVIMYRHASGDEYDDNDANAVIMKTIMMKITIEERAMMMMCFARLPMAQKYISSHGQVQCLPCVHQCGPTDCTCHSAQTTLY